MELRNKANLDLIEAYANNKICINDFAKSFKPENELCYHCLWEHSCDQEIKEGFDERWSRDEMVCDGFTHKDYLDVKPTFKNNNLLFQ